MDQRLSYIWTFSPVSRPLLERFLNAASMLPPDDTNKWLQRFGHINTDLSKETDHTASIEDCLELEIIPNPVDLQKDVEMLEDVGELVQVLLDKETHIESKFDHIFKKCRVTPKLLAKLAENLPSDIIEKLTFHIFDTTNNCNEFLKYFYQYFVPVFIRKHNSRLCTELLIKTNKLHMDCFKIILKVILQDINIQNSVLNDYILTLNGDQQTKLLNDIYNIDVSDKEFLHNVFNIYTAYRTCNKTESLQKKLFSLLKSHSLHCSANKSYGKLLLAYLQQEKDLKINCNYKEIENIIEIHTSSFKRPCLSILEEIKNSS